MNDFNWASIGSGLTAAFVSLIGGYSPYMLILVVAVGLDYLTGLIVAGTGHSLKSESGGINSQVGFKGLLKKMLIFILVAVGALVDRVVGSGNAIRDGVMMFFFANEAISITENIGLAGVPLPKILVKALEQLKDNEEE